MYRIGIDLGGTNIAVGVVDDTNYEIIGRASEKTNLPSSAESIVEKIGRAVKNAVENAGISMDSVVSAGIGAPGAVTYDGFVEFSSNFGFENVPLRSMVEMEILKPVQIENDANCAAIGERFAGCGNLSDDFIAITLGTGIGGGIISNGRLITGVNGAAGEIGHFVIEKDGIECPCGRHGCFEQYASATALIRQTKEALMKDTDHTSKMWTIIDGDINRVNGKTPFDGLHIKDTLAKQVIDNFVKYLGCGVTSLVNIFQPEILCIGGGISNAGDDIIIPLMKIVERERYTKHSKKQTKICTATLGNDAGIIGAALINTLE